MNSSVSVMRSFPNNETHQETIELRGGSRTFTETLSCIFAGRTVTYYLQFSIEDCQSNLVMGSIICKLIILKDVSVNMHELLIQ